MLTVIIVNYNGALFIKKCLDSVMHQLAHMPHMKIIVIDNASTDASLDCIAPYESNITLIKNTVNVGFPAAHNQILDQLSTPYLWLLNNDTEFSHATDLVSPIIDYFEANPSTVGLSPKLLNTDGTLQAQGSGFSRWVFNTNKTRAVRFLSGASLFIRTSFFKSIQGFDPQLFFYNDDIDFAMQAKKHKKKLIYFPSLEVTHHGGLSTAFNPISTQIGGYFGSVYLCKKYYPRLIFYLYFLLVWLLITLKKGYYMCMKTDASSEWVTELTHLQQRLAHDI